jgi:hypothetical protein
MVVEAESLMRCGKNFSLRLRVAYEDFERLKSSDLGYQNHPTIILFDSQSKPS